MTKPDITCLNGNLFSAGVVSIWQEEDVVDLNDIFRNVLNRYTPDGGLIFRSDKLPLVKGNPEHFTCLFDALLSMIISHPPLGSKLFLYVKCFTDIPDSDVMDLRVEGDAGLFKIQMFCNITTDKNWEILYQDKLADCSAQAAKLSANFSFFPIVNTGCLFSLTLPGKIN